MKLSTLSSLFVLAFLAIAPRAQATVGVLAACEGKSVKKLIVVQWGGSIGCGTQIRITDEEGEKSYSNNAVCDPTDYNSFTLAGISEKVIRPGVAGKGVMVAVDLRQERGALARDGLIELLKCREGRLEDDQ